jgi:predicted nucleic acid-binding protein
VSVSFDANVLVYALDPNGGARRHRAADLVERAFQLRRGILLFQAMAEFYSVVVRKFGTDPEDARDFLEGLRVALRVHTADERDFDIATIEGRSHGLPFWDALLWATADRVGVRYLITEDFQDGRVLGGVTFVNPFNRAHDALLDRELPPRSAPPG